MKMKKILWGCLGLAFFTLTAQIQADEANPVPEYCSQAAEELNSTQVQECIHHLQGQLANYQKILGLENSDPNLGGEGSMLSHNDPQLFKEDTVSSNPPQIHPVNNPVSSNPPQIYPNSGTRSSNPPQLMPIQGASTAQSSANTQTSFRSHLNTLLRR